MDPIPVFFDNIDRSALVIKPKKPFIDWLIRLDNTLDYSEITYDTDVYLLPDFEEQKQMESWLRRNFDKIFVDQLNNWYTNESLWVQNRTFKMFKDWFEYSLHTMIFDTQEREIYKM